MTLTISRFLLSPNFFCIKVGAGDNQKAFYVHDEVLTKSSPYFAALIDSNFIEAATKEVVLGEAVDSPEAFKFIVDYMYNGCQSYKVELKPTIRTALYSTAGIVHARIFLMANRLCMAGLQELAYREIKACLNNETFKNRTNTGNWNTENLCTVIDLIYSNTCTSLNDASTATTKSSQGNIIIRIRELFAFYIACCLPSYKERQSFKAVMRKRPDFAEDVLSQLLPREDRASLEKI